MVYGETTIYVIRVNRAHSTTVRLFLAKLYIIVFSQTVLL